MRQVLLNPQHNGSKETAAELALVRSRCDPDDWGVSQGHRPGRLNDNFGSPETE